MRPQAGLACCKAQLGPDLIVHLRPPPAPPVETANSPRPSSSLLHHFPLRASQAQGCCLRALWSTSPSCPRTSSPASLAPRLPPTPAWGFCSLTSAIWTFSPTSSSLTCRQLFPNQVHAHGCLSHVLREASNAARPELQRLPSCEAASAARTRLTALWGAAPHTCLRLPLARATAQLLFHHGPSHHFLCLSPPGLLPLPSSPF